MNQTHTPKPWRWMNDSVLVADTGRRPVVLAAGRRSNDDDAPAMRQARDGRMVLFDPDSPDGRLIAAAPDLAEALAEIQHRVQLWPTMMAPGDMKLNVDAVVEIARAALAKAGVR